MKEGRKEDREGRTNKVDVLVDETVEEEEAAVSERKRTTRRSSKRQGERTEERNSLVGELVGHVEHRRVLVGVLVPTRKSHVALRVASVVETPTSHWPTSHG